MAASESESLQSESESYESQSCESSPLSSSELSTSSESDNADEFTTSTKRKAPLKSTTKSKTTTRPSSSSAASKSSKSKGRRTRKKSKLSEQEINELSTWVYSEEESAIVGEKVRNKLLECGRVTSHAECRLFAEHILSEPQQLNFNVLIVGFCRKFSSLIEKCFEDSEETYRKAAFSIAWMKNLANFLPGKELQERYIVERFLADMEFSPAAVHAVMSMIHELIYTIIHEHVRVKKSTTQEESEQPCVLIAEESEDTLYRYCGASLQRMIKLRKDTGTKKKDGGNYQKIGDHAWKGNLRFCRSW